MSRVVSENFEQQKGMLLDAAVESFAADGFTRASMNRIAQRAGVSKALIYHYFPGKEHLLHAAMLRYLLGLKSALASTGARGDRSLDATLRRLLDRYHATQHDHTVLMAELRHLPAELRGPVVGLQRDVLAVMRRASARAAPAIRAEDLGAVTMLVMGMVNWLHTWYRKGGPVAQDRLADLVLRMVGGALQGVGCSREGASA